MFLLSHKDILFFLTVAESINPLSYSHLKYRHLIEALSYFFSVIFVCIFISSLFYLPALFSLNSSVNSELGKFESIGFSYDLQNNEPVQFSFFGINALNVGNATGNYLYSVNSEGISSSSIACSIFSPLCRLFPKSEITADELNDLSQNREQLANIVTNVILLNLPGIFITAMLYYLAKYLVIAIFCTIIGLVIAKIFRFELNLNSSFSSSSYSLTVLIVPQLLSRSLGIDLFGIEWLAFSALFISGLILSGKKIEGDKHGHGRSSENQHPGKGIA